MAKVIVELCGDNDPHGPKGWPKRTLAAPVDGAVEMEPDEFQKYCESMQAAYLDWVKSKKPDLAAKVESVPDAAPEADLQLQGFIAEPDTHESFEAEVIAPKKKIGKKHK